MNAAAIIMSTGLVAVGVCLIVFAKLLSDFERRLITRHPAATVTGWSGTRKGVFSWRIAGGISVAAGAFVFVLDLLHVPH